MKTAAGSEDSTQAHGGDVKRSRFPFHGAVYAFLFDENERVLLQKRQNTGFEDGRYGAPSGKIDGNEPVALAALRELREREGGKAERDSIGRYSRVRSQML